MRASLPRKLACSAVLLALVASGCSRDDVQNASADGTTTSTSTSTSTTEAPTTTSTTVAPTTSSTAPPFTGFKQGSKGDDVRAMEQKLADMQYDAGKVDGVFDAATGHAVMAFQKVTGMDRSGRATPDVIEAIAKANAPGPMLPDGGPNRVEIDLKKQAMQVYKGGELARVLSVSSGNNKKYCVEGECDVAVTPGGSFKVNRKIRGIRVSRLGELFNPLYFNGGIAMHGSPSVPAFPASHGCVRVPMNSSLWLFDNVPMGTPVYVLGGKKAPVPFNEQAPPAVAEETTTTTAAPTTSSSSTPAPTSSSTTVAPATTTTTEAPPTTTTPSTPPPG